MGIFREEKVTGAVIKEAHSSTHTDYNISRDYAVPPTVQFSKCMEYYLTVGKVQNVIESFISQIINRDWFWESEDESMIKQMEKWEGQIHFSKFIEDLVRNWLIFGHIIIGKSDMAHVQYSTIKGMVRDEFGHAKKFIQQLGYDQIELDAKDFFSEPFIHLDRQGFGIGLYHSLMNSYIDENGKGSKPLLEIYRDMEQDIAKIHRKYASPRTIFSFPEASQAQMDTDILPLMKNLKQGDRLAINFKPELIQETVDGKARFTDSITQINAEVESGLQSSASRLITQPSAMADARVAQGADDERVLAVMEKIRRFIDERVLPHVLGESNVCSFNWGAKDDFDLTFPAGLEKAISLGLVKPEEAREILASRGWKLPELTEPLQQPQPEPQPQQQFPSANDPLSMDQETEKLRKQAYESILKELDKKPAKRKTTTTRKKVESKKSSKKSDSS